MIGVIKMAKKGTYGYRAGLERKNAQRRIEWNERILSRQNLPTRTRERHESEIRDLKAAQEATRQRTKSGKVISGRSDAEKIKLQELLQMHPALSGEIYTILCGAGKHHR